MKTGNLPLGILIFFLITARALCLHEISDARVDVSILNVPKIRTSEKRPFEIKEKKEKKGEGKDEAETADAFWLERQRAIASSTALQSEVFASLENLAKIAIAEKTETEDLEAAIVIPIDTGAINPPPPPEGNTSNVTSDETSETFFEQLGPDNNLSVIQSGGLNKFHAVQNELNVLTAVQRGNSVIEVSQLGTKNAADFDAKNGYIYVSQPGNGNFTQIKIR